MGYDVGQLPELSIVIFRIVQVAKEINTYYQGIVDRIRDDGPMFLPSTTIEDVFWIRFAVLSFRTYLKQVDWALRWLEGLAK